MLLRASRCQNKLFHTDLVSGRTYLEVSLPFASKPFRLHLRRLKTLQKRDPLTFHNYDRVSDATIRRDRVTETGFVSTRVEDGSKFLRAAVLLGGLVSLAMAGYLILWAAGTYTEGPIDVFARSVHGDAEVTEALTAVKELLRQEKVVAIVPAADLRNKAYRAAIVRGCDSPCYEIPVTDDFPAVYRTVIGTFAHTASLPILIVNGATVVIGYDTVTGLYNSGQLHKMLGKPVPRTIPPLSDLLD